MTDDPQYILNENVFVEIGPILRRMWTRICSVAPDVPTADLRQIFQEAVERKLIPYLIAAGPPSSGAIGRDHKRRTPIAMRYTFERVMCEIVAEERQSSP